MILYDDILIIIFKYSLYKLSNLYKIKQINKKCLNISTLNIILKNSLLKINKNVANKNIINLLKKLNNITHLDIGMCKNATYTNLKLLSNQIYLQELYVNYNTFINNSYWDEYSIIHIITSIKSLKKLYINFYHLASILTIEDQTCDMNRFFRKMTIKQDLDVLYKNNISLQIMYY